MIYKFLFPKHAIMCDFYVSLFAVLGLFQTAVFRRDLGFNF